MISNNSQAPIIASSGSVLSFGMHANFLTRHHIEGHGGEGWIRCTLTITCTKRISGTHSSVEMSDDTICLQSMAVFTEMSFYVFGNNEFWLKIC